MVRWHRVLLHTLRMAFVVATTALPLTGCQTAAQQEAVTIRDTIARADAEGQACTTALLENPEYTPIFRRFRPTPDTQPTLAQMADEALPTLEEVRLFMGWHSGNQECRRQFLKTIQTVSPDMARISAANYARADTIYAAFARREISWGVLNSRFVAQLAEAKERWAQAAAQMDMRLERAHQAEVARRQAAAAAFSAAAANMQQQLQQQQMINAINRPVMTNCNRIGNNVSCTSF